MSEQKSKVNKFSPLNNSEEQPSNQNVQLLAIQQEQSFSILQELPSNKYGKLICLMPDESGQPRFLLGPHYPLFLTAIGICAILEGMLIYYQFWRLSVIWQVIIIISASLFLGSYLRIGLSKPGIAVAYRCPTEQQKNDRRYCKYCKIVRQRRTQHCFDCNVCIIGYDHHCPWIGKCVGRDNLCQFYVFLISTFGNLIICFLATSIGNMMAINNNPNPKAPNLKIQT